MSHRSVLGAATAAFLVCAVGAVATAGPARPARTAEAAPGSLSGMRAGVAPSKETLAAQAKDPGSITTRLAEVNDVYRQLRGPTYPAAAPGGPQPVIYGADDRVDVYAETDPALVELAASTAVVTNASALTDNGNGTYSLSASPWTSQGGTLCPDEPFRGQLQGGFCSSFLVGGDLIVTAGHCVDSGDISSGVAFVFGFYEIDEATAANVASIPAENVYFGQAIVNQALSSGLDHSVVRLDREVTGRNPLPLNRTGPSPVGSPLLVIGHPAGLPTKIAGGAEVKGIQSTFIQSNLDTYGGNSGSAVFNANTLEVEGILVRGAPDYVSVGGCVRSNEVPDTGNTGGGLAFEEVSRSSTFLQFVPELGLAVSPGGSTLHIGPVGGPFTPASVTYTLSNPTSNPIDYSVSFVNGIGLEMNGGAGPISGQLPGSGQAMVTITVPASFSGAAAGLYAETVDFDDITNARTISRGHTVEIGQSIVGITPATGIYASGPLGGPFVGSGSYTVTNQRPTTTTIRVTASDSWITLNGGSGPVNLPLTGLVGDSMGVSVGIGPDALALGNGIYAGAVTFENLVSGAIFSRDVTIDVGRYILPAQDTPIAINDNSTLTSTVNFSDALCVGNVEVDVDISHTYIGDLIVELTSPEGTVVRLHNRTGGTTDNLMTTYADSGATTPDGPGSLGDFNGEGTQGNWTLRVSDNASIDTGTLNGWALRLSPSGGGCAPVAFGKTVSSTVNDLEMIELEGASRVGGTLDYIITGLPTAGQVWEPGATTAILSTPHQLSGNEVVYRPVPGSSAAASFTFAVDDGQTSADATVGITYDNSGAAYFFPMDSNPGWTTQGQWAFGTPTGGGSSTGDPDSGHTGSNVYGYNLAGDYPNGLAATHLTSTPIDCSGLTGVRVRYFRWLGVERSLYDKASFSVSTNGSTFTTLYSNPDTSFTDTSWVEQEFDISALADGASTLYLRWTMGTTDGSVTYPGWNVDDVAILADLPAPCAADLTTTGTTNGIPDGVANGSDFTYYLSLFAVSSPQADLTTTGTSNGIPDGIVNGSDFTSFLSLFAAGCP